MTPKQKLTAYNKMKASQHLEKDLYLLKDKNPNHPLLKARITKSDKYANEVLYALLDLAAPEEIRQNRRNSLSEYGYHVDKIKEYTPALLNNSIDNKQKLETVHKIKEHLSEIPVDIKKHLPGDINGFSLDLLDENKYSTLTVINGDGEQLPLVSDEQKTDEGTGEENEKIKTGNTLIKLDLSTLPYDDKLKLLVALKLDVGIPNKKKKTITAVLQEKKDELLDAINGENVNVEGTGEEIAGDITVTGENVDTEKKT